ncbi:MAG: chemotaxis protein CheA [Dehalococcoidia bacterium]
MRHTLRFELDDEELKLFCEETDEQIELLDRALVQLEGAPDPELVQQIFRAAHTLKGASATIGHTKMASLTHAMETVLDAVRQGRASPTATVVDALLAGVDALRQLAGEVVTAVDSGIETSALEAALLATVDDDPDLAGAGDGRAPAAGRPAYTLSGERLAEARAALEQGRSAYLVEVAVHGDCPLPAIRCYQALQELDALGTVAGLWPDRATIESGAGQRALAAILLTTAAREHLWAALAAVPDVASASVQALGSDELAEAARTPPGGGDYARQRQGASTLVAERPNPGPPKPSRSVRIDVERLDGLMRWVSELVTDGKQLQEVSEQLGAAVTDQALLGLTATLEATALRLTKATAQMEEEMRRSRMVPLQSILTRLPRVVRDVAAQCGKSVQLATSGEDLELDRAVVEELSAPLVHIVRNAVGHGIETPEQRRATGKRPTGSIQVSAWIDRAGTCISVKDDGKGIDVGTLRAKAILSGLVDRAAAEAASDDAVLRYIFFPGLSTATTISDVSGRGVGMDIVRNNIERLNGRIDVKSTPGAGTEFIIQLP